MKKKRSVPLLISLFILLLSGIVFLLIDWGFRELGLPVLPKLAPTPTLAPGLPTCAMAGSSSAIVGETLTLQIKTTPGKVEVWSGRSREEARQLADYSCGQLSCQFSFDWETSGVIPRVYSWQADREKFYFWCEVVEGEKRCSGNPWEREAGNYGCDPYSGEGKDRLEITLERCHVENLNCTYTEGRVDLEWQLAPTEVGIYQGGADGVILKRLDDGVNLCVYSWVEEKMTSCEDTVGGNQRRYQAACYQGDPNNENYHFGESSVVECGPEKKKPASGGASCEF